MRKGFTLIELLAVIVILAIIALISTPIILNLIDNARKGAFKDSAYGILESAELNYTQDILAGNTGEVVYTYTNGIESPNITGKTLDYKGDKPKNGTITVNNEGKVAIAIHDGTYCAEKGYNDTVVTVSDKSVDECTIQQEITYTDFSEEKRVNIPKLSTGMTPVKWDGTNWVNTTEDDTEWYDYSTKKWANVMTNDGSFWVWIPRYAYSITSGYHTSTAGTINVKFLIDKTSITLDGTTIDATPTYTGDSQTNYVKHPAFTFGDLELTGIWVAKFEASNNGSYKVKVVPNVNMWETVSVSYSFDRTIEMKTDTIYGWQSTEVDTHLIKNSEWGAVAYLSKSIYGKEDEIWINPNSYKKTGCAGTWTSQSQTTSCNQYNTTYGMNASTTGNIYGVYDMSGGGWERVAAYVNNGNSNLITYGSSLINADDKYKDVYNIGISDTLADNYNVLSTIIGDGLYETSLQTGSSNSWYSDHSYMVYLSVPFFLRGGTYYDTNKSGLYSFYHYSGSNGYFFRPVVIILE